MEQRDAIEAYAAVHYLGNVSAVMREIVREWLGEHPEWRREAERRLKAGGKVTVPRSGMMRLAHADEEHSPLAFSVPLVEQGAVRLAATNAGIEKASYYRTEVIANWMDAHRRKIKSALRRIEAGERAASEGSTRAGRHEAAREKAQAMLSEPFLVATGKLAA